jgi:hypothetical protein
MTLTSGAMRMLARSCTNGGATSDQAEMAELRADHRMQPGHPGRALGQPRPRQRPAAGLHQLDIMMIFGPVITHQQHARLQSRCRETRWQPAGKPSAT